MGRMRWVLGFLLVFCILGADVQGVLEKNQTYINDYLLGKGLIKEIMMHNLSAVKCVEGTKLYLKAERILPSDRGLMLIGDDLSLTFLPKVYSDDFGCYIRSALICTDCAHQYSAESFPIGCPLCRSD